MTISGGILNVLNSGTTSFHAYTGRGFRIQSEIRGPGTLKLCNGSSGNKADGTIDLTGLNTNFVGKLIIKDDGNSSPTASDYLTTELSDARNWGGRGSAAADAFDAITLDGWPVVKVAADVTFAAGTRLVVPAGAVGGLYNVASATPLAFADAQLAVDIDGIDEKPQRDVEVTLCTLNATAAASIPETAFAIAESTACRIKSVEKCVQSDGSVAYVATVAGKVGLAVLLR